MLILVTKIKLDCISIEISQLHASPKTNTVCTRVDDTIRAKFNKYLHQVFSFTFKMKINVDVLNYSNLFRSYAL